jgi:sulfur relay (sulfurtransferase) DsrC/TusE family protein
VEIFKKYDMIQKRKEKKYMAFIDDMKLDVLDLDRAALDQPRLYAENGEDWARAILERDRIKEQLSAKKTEVDESVRNDPEKYGATNSAKITETWIANKIAQDEGVTELVEKLNTAQYNVNMMTVGKEALDHRLQVLKILTELYKGNYFTAQSRMTDSYKKAVEKIEEEQAEGAGASPRMKALIKKRAQENGTDT